MVGDNYMCVFGPSIRIIKHLKSGMVVPRKKALLDRIFDAYSKTR